MQFNGEGVSQDAFLLKLKDRLSTADISQAKADVLPFVRNPRELDICLTIISCSWQV